MNSNIDKDWLDFTNLRAYNSYINWRIAMLKIVEKEDNLWYVNIPMFMTDAEGNDITQLGPFPNEKRAEEVLQNVQTILVGGYL